MTLKVMLFIQEKNQPKNSISNKNPTIRMAIIEITNNNGNNSITKVIPIQYNIMNKIIPAINFKIFILFPQFI